MMNEICDKCGKRKATHFHTSSSAPTISLCPQCNYEYNVYMWEAETRFFGREMSDKPKSATEKFFDIMHKFKLPEIKEGDKLKCLKCKKTILLDNDTFKMSADGEYIHCPHCNSDIDTQYYHIMGTMAVD